MIPEQLTFIYLNLENWHKKKLPEAQANAYHERLLMQGNIITYVNDGILLGYIETWRINTEQLGRIIIGEPIATDTEDILTGPIAYINNMFILADHRNGKVFDLLASMFLAKNHDATHFVACRQGKHQTPVQVYSKSDLIKLYTKGV